MGLGDMPLEENLEERKPLESLPAADVIEWLQERAANCRRLSALSSHGDVEGWLDDAHYFDSAISLLAKSSPSEEGTGWIEIREGCRLPEYGDIVTMINSTTLGGPYQETCDWNLAGDWHEAKDAGVTHWKPIDWPAEYKKEQ